MPSIHTRKISPIPVVEGTCCRSKASVSVLILFLLLKYCTFVTAHQLRWPGTISVKCSRLGPTASNLLSDFPFTHVFTLAFRPLGNGCIEGKLCSLFNSSPEIHIQNRISTLAFWWILDCRIRYQRPPFWINGNFAYNLYKRWWDIEGNGLTYPVSTAPGLKKLMNASSRDVPDASSLTQKIFRSFDVQYPLMGPL